MIGMLNMDFVVIISVIFIAIGTAIAHYLQYRLSKNQINKIEENVKKYLEEKNKIR